MPEPAQLEQSEWARLCCHHWRTPAFDAQHTCRRDPGHDGEHVCTCGARIDG